MGIVGERFGKAASEKIEKKMHYVRASRSYSGYMSQF
jgi:hypothetical protein